MLRPRSWPTIAPIFAAREARVADIEVRGCDHPLRPAPAERDVRRRVQARKRVEAVLRVVQLCGMARGLVNERRVRVDKRLRADRERAAGELSERGAGDDVALDLTAVELEAGLGLCGLIESWDCMCPWSYSTRNIRRRLRSADPARNYRQHRVLRLHCMRLTHSRSQ